MRVSTTIGAIIIFAVVTAAGIFIWTIDQYRDEAVKQREANENILEYQLERDERPLGNAINETEELENAE
jgi:hypothetical protein